MAEVVQLNESTSETNVCEHLVFSVSLLNFPVADPLHRLLQAAGVQRSDCEDFATFDFSSSNWNVTQESLDICHGFYVWDDQNRCRAMSWNFMHCTVFPVITWEDSLDDGKNLTLLIQSKCERVFSREHGESVADVRRRAVEYVEHNYHPYIERQLVSD